MICHVHHGTGAAEYTPAPLNQPDMTHGDDRSHQTTSISGGSRNPVPTGMHPRVECKPRHEQLFDSTGLSSSAVLDFNEIRTLQRRGLKADDYLGPMVDIISITTISDEDLYDLSLREELEIVQEVAPHWHIGFDCPVYKAGDMDADQRWENIKNYVVGINWLADQVDTDQTTIVPFLKGTCPAEWEWCYNRVKHICNGQVAYYAGQYFGPTVGCRNKQLERHLWTIDSTCNPNGIFLIGLLSPNYLRPLPRSVIASTGLQQWISRTEFRDVPIEQARTRYQQLASEVNTCLGTGYTQAGLQQFADASGDIHG